MKKTWAKGISVLLSAAMAVSLTACAGSAASESKGEQTTAGEAQTTAGTQAAGGKETEAQAQGGWRERDRGAGAGRRVR